jgi:hypothetical protein
MKLYIFRTVPLPIIRSFSLYTQQWYMSHRFADSLQAGSGCSILILLASCQQTGMTYIIAMCTVKNSWWWIEELSETCRFSFQNKFKKLVHLVGFILRNLYSAQGSLLSVQDRHINHKTFIFVLKWLRSASYWDNVLLTKLAPWSRTVQIHHLFTGRHAQ